MKGTFSTLKQILKQSEHATGFLECIIPMKQEEGKKETGTEKGKRIQFITTSKKNHRLEIGHIVFLQRAHMEP